MSVYLYTHYTMIKGESDSSWLQYHIWRHYSGCADSAPEIERILIRYGYHIDVDDYTLMRVRLILLRSRGSDNWPLVYYRVGII